MPIYEYRCDDCGLQKETLQKMNAEPIATCPSCGSAHYRKLVSAAGFQLKGSGWYASDFKSKSSSASSASSESSAAPASTPCGGSCACH